MTATDRYTHTDRLRLRLFDIEYQIAELARIRQRVVAALAEAVHRPSDVASTESPLKGEAT